MSDTATSATVVEIPRIDGSSQRVRFDLPRETVNTVLRFAARQDVRPDVLVMKLMPQNSEGRDIYEQIRAANPGHFWDVAWTQFPTDRIPRTWVSWLNALEEVWVPSRFNRETFRRAGVQRDKLRVMPPLAAQLRAPADPGSIYRLEAERSFRFLSVTDLTPRRGLDLLLGAYLAEFAPDDDVSLVLRIPPPKKAPAFTPEPPPAIDVIMRMIDALGHDPEHIPEIVLVDEPLGLEALGDLYAQCQAFALPSRGEAVGSACFEAFAMGMPVIATRFGGWLEYLREDNAFLVDIAGLTPITNQDAPDQPLLVGHRWAKPRLDALRARLRQVFTDRAEAARRGGVARAEAAQRWTLGRLVERITDRLRAIEGCHPALTRPRSGGVTTRVAWRAAAFDQSGYASEARGFIRSLARDQGLLCRVVPHIWSNRAATLDLEDRVLLHRLCNVPVAGRHVSVQHLFPSMFQREPDHAVAIGRTMFETDRIPADWVAPCNRMDEIWVPCAHNVESFAAAGVDRHRLVVVTGTLDFAGYTAEGHRLPQIPADAFTFLSVFDWHLRKGWDVLVRAYAEAFGGRNDVALVLKLQLSNGMPLDDVKRIVRQTMSKAIKKGRSLPPVHYVGRLAEADLPALYRSCRAFVLPTRGEGFGRPFAEAMAVGLPTIGTNWSGQVDFMNASNAYPIDYRLVPVSPEGVREVPNFRGHQWAEPDVAHLRRLMLEVRDDAAGAEARGRQAALDVRRLLSPAVVSAAIKERLEQWIRKLG